MGNLEDRAMAARTAVDGYAVEVAAGPQDETDRFVAIRGEGIEYGFDAGRGNLEDRATAARTTGDSCAVEVAASTQDEAAGREGTIRAFSGG